MKGFKAGLFSCVLVLLCCLANMGLASAAPGWGLIKKCFNASGPGLQGIGSAGWAVQHSSGALSSVEDGYKEISQTGVSYESCVKIFDGATQGLLAADSGVSAVAMANSLGLVTLGEGAAGFVSTLTPVGWAPMAGGAINMCLVGPMEDANDQAEDCLRREIRANRLVLGCRRLDRALAQINSTLQTLQQRLNNQSSSIAERWNLQNQQAQLVQDAKILTDLVVECKRDKEAQIAALKDALSVGFCSRFQPGMDSELIRMRCRSILNVMCNAAPELKARRERLQRELNVLGISIPPCTLNAQGIPVAAPSPIASWQSQLDESRGDTQAKWGEREFAPVPPVVSRK